MAHVGIGKYVFGTSKINEKGQLVIPKDARDLFNIKPGDTLLILGQKDKGLAIVKADGLTGLVSHYFNHKRP